MSSCLILQCKNKLYIGSDTSSSIFIKDKLYRLNNHTKKLFKLNNSTIMYCAGNNLIAKIVAQYIYFIFNRPDFSFEDLKKWLKQNYPYRNNKKTIYDVEILIATFANENTIVYQISQYNNYEIVKFEINNLGVQILSAGIKNKECMNYAEIELTKKHSVESIFYNTFCNLSCNYIGGNLDLYEVSKDGIVTIFDNKKINEFGIQYVNEILNNNISVSINAEVLMSKLVMSQNLWIENQSGTYKFDDAGFIASSGKNSVRIQPNKSGELFSIYKGNNKQFYVDSDGNVHFAGDLTGSSGTFSGNISGGSINLGNGTFTVDKNGKMNASSGTFTGELKGNTITGANISGGSINLGNGVFTVDKSGNMYASSGTFSGTIHCSSGTVGGWNIGTQDLSATSYFDGNYYTTRIIPGQIQFTSLSDSDDYMYINPNGLAFNNSLTYIGKHKGMVRQFTCQNLHFGTTSSATVTWDSTTTLTFGKSGCTNVHFYNTPYIDSYNSYLAREGWCNDKFALKTDLSKYLTSSSLNGYTTNTHLENRIEDVKNWVRNNFKKS